MAAKAFLVLILLSSTIHAQTWTRLAPAQEARQEVAVTELNGEVYLIGGIRGTSISTTVEAYNPATDKWRTIAPLPEPLHHSSAVSLKGKLYVIGGYSDIRFTPVDSVYSYDPANNTWQAVARLPQRRGALASAVIDGKIYTVGGSSGGATGELTVYDPEANRWARLAAMPTPREHHAAAAINGKLYVAGGRRPGNFTLSTLEEYNPQTNEWRALASMPTGRSGIAAAAANGRMYVFGGEGNSASPTGTFQENESYDPASNSWRQELPMPMPRHGIGAAVIANRIYIPAGAPIQGFSITDYHDAYEVASNTNLAPIVDPIAPQRLRGGTQLCLQVNAVDPEGESLKLECDPANPTYATCKGFEICLTPDANEEGTGNVCFTISDLSGKSTRVCFTVEVFINHAPRFLPIQDLTMTEGDALSVAVVAFDDDRERDPLADGFIRLSLLEAPRFSSLTDTPSTGDGNATLTFAPLIGDGAGSKQTYRVALQAIDQGQPPLESTLAFNLTVKVKAPAPFISSASFSSKMLTIRGIELGPSPGVEVNGLAVDPVRISTAGTDEVRASGNRKKLGLKRGDNVLIVIVGGVRSAPFNLRLD